ncbi:DEAD/SNF2-like helicase [Yasminevirus sp. GU-2018]|uniref:DEAD/SNF2-like helicase n=1 Tax=Yasminevirus sp. GU-2018 TaxID=2420051 RepID=A0A5K0UAC9_9VIRU|nr:DEAD/SNF2-like helicase [Yasminevirus sp. GU-2018]
MTYTDLNEDSERIIQPIDLKVELMQHQKTAVFAMKDLENKGYVDVKFRYYDNEEKDLRIGTNIGVLGDKVGSGKTLIITSLILESPRPTDRPVYFASDKYTTIREIGINDDEKLDINVIVVPKGIQHQWEDAFKNFVKEGALTYVSHVDASTRDQLSDTVDTNDKPYIILCNERSVSDVQEKYSGKRWSRFILDEADTVQFASMAKVNASFIWLVTGTTNGIPYSKKKYIKDIFGKNITWQPDFLTIKNKNEYIDSSIQLPKPNRITIRCKTPYEVKLLAEHIPANIMNMINAGNSDEAIRALNCHADTKDNIFTVIERNYDMAIKNKEIELTAEKKKKYTSFEKTHEHKKRINRLEAVILKLKNKLESMKKSLYDANDELCPVCMCEFEKPTIVDCCAHKYCFNCLTLTMNKTGQKCPVCQTKITKNRMHVVTDQVAEEDDYDTNVPKKEQEVKREKMEELCKLVNSKKEGKFLVFADYDETFSKIEQVFKKQKIKYGILKGSSSVIRSTIEDFKKGKIKVIMLNAKNFGAGMNLQCATDIVMYHRFTKEMEEQIIGRGQRLGREGTLNVYYLIHDNEDASYVDPNFTDMNYQEWVEDGQDNIEDIKQDDH